jgi:hypothetical protein
MRILHWHEQAGTAGGAESMLRDLTKALKDLGHEVAWLHNDKIQEAVETWKPDIVQIWTINNTMPLSVTDYLYDNHIPAAFCLMNYWPFCSQNVCLKNQDESCNAVNNECDGNCQSNRVNHSEVINRFPVISLNQYSGEMFKRNGIRCDYIGELGIDTDMFKPDPSLRENEIQIYTSSAWVDYPHKGMKYLQEAVEGLYNVKLMSGLTREQVAIGLKHADIYVFPSTYEETWGLCLTEAMASGCACISTDIAGARAQIHSGTGLLVPARSAKDIRDAITALVKNKRLREFFSNNAYEHVLQDHTLKAMGKRYAKIYEDIISKS